jgi:hypothetical protein
VTFNLYCREFVLTSRALMGPATLHGGVPFIVRKDWRVVGIPEVLSVSSSYVLAE